jgi:hypothetical protein
MTRNHLQPRRNPEALSAGEKNELSALSRMVSVMFASWNRIGEWLRQLEALRDAA